jgi:hypothetical protein
VSTSFTSVTVQLTVVILQLSSANYEAFYWSKNCPFHYWSKICPFLLLVENLSHALGSQKHVRLKCVCPENVAAPFDTSFPSHIFDIDNIVWYQDFSMIVKSKIDIYVPEINDLNACILKKRYRKRYLKRNTHHITTKTSQDVITTILDRLLSVLINAVIVCFTFLSSVVHMT